MKILSINIVVILTLFSCSKFNTNYNDLVLKSIEKNKLQTPIIIHKTNNNEFLKENSKFKLLTTKELLEKKDENFYSLNINDKNKIIEIGFSNYKSGIDYITIFDKNELIKNNIINVKRGESKAYYIYWAIMKEKYPSFMNLKDFKIPKDSLN